MWTRDRNIPGPGRAPDQLPLLQRGHHRRPEDGACVMEYVSVLAGGKFTDHPRCTHPALATLARLVNDWIDDDEARSKLALLAPDLIGAGGGDLRTTQCVVACCLRAAATVRGLPPGAERQLARARRRIGDISQKMLATTLRALERDGFVSRRVLPTNPPQVEYALTELGQSLLVPVVALVEWTQANSERIEAARRAYADRERGPAARPAEMHPAE